MQKAKLYNSLTKKIEDFEEPGDQVKIYHCGPTVYKRQHIGNMRRYLFADILGRSLRFLGYEVESVMNITDVGHLTQDDIDAGEDKLEMEAKAQSKTPEEIAEVQIKLFKQDLADLNIQPADKYPRATKNIEQMIEIIEKLVEKDKAYISKSGVYFDVTSFEDYGKLSGNTLDNLNAGARVEVLGDKKNPGDFALWKLDDPEHLQFWDSPWGKGYPGWHIECSAMAGEWMDIHTGGEDNKFPHHENEIAQSESLYGKPFVGTWMHNAHLKLGGEKLAKREGTQITLDTLNDKGYSPLAFRLLVFGSHYRSPMEFSWDLLDSAEKNLEGFRQVVRSHLLPPSLKLRGTSPHLEKFSEALADDLNTPKALAVVIDFMKKINSGETEESYEVLMKMDAVLGIFGELREEIESEEIPKEVMKLVKEREKARQSDHFEEADRLREEIETRGFVVEDTDEGSRVIRK